LCSQAQADERAAILKEQLEVRRQAVFDRVQREAKAEAKQNEVSNLRNIENHVYVVVQKGSDTRNLAPRIVLYLNLCRKIFQVW
jgi:hypothetical protein